MTITYHAGRRIQGLSTDIVETPTFEDDFSSYADQTAFDASWVTSNTAKFRGNPSNDNVDILTSNSYDNIYYDLTSVSDTKWLCRFKVTLTTAGSQSLGICYFYIGTTTGDANESQSGLGFYFYDNANSTNALADNANRPDQTSVTGNLGINPSATTYYAEMKRTSATSFTVTLYSDSSYSTSLGTSTLTINSGITGLRYFKIMGYNTTGGLVGTLDDFKFWNGVSSLTSKPTNVQSGSRFEETDTRKIYYRVDYDNDKWQEEGSIYLGGRGVWGGGTTGTNSDVIDYIAIATTGNATDFGNLTVARSVNASCDDGSRGLFCGVASGTIDYITIATTGNATDFGDLNTAGDSAGGVSSDTRGCIGGGYIGGGNSTNVIDYVTIQTTGNATDFGDLTRSEYGIAGGLSNGTRGCFAGGSGSSNTIDYITIATTGNATDFGDLTVGRYNMQGLSNSTRGCIGGGTTGGTNRQNVIDYITIATTGNATDFGDLTVARHSAGGVSSETRGVWGSGVDASTYSNVIDYITIDTTGNATDFGDVTVARRACSGVAD